MGFSGDPVVNQGGEVVGLTTARIGTGGAGLLGSLTGIDLAGLANPMGREVFVLRLPPGDYAGLR
jgi:S1-C subfamily serine protease